MIQRRKFLTGLLGLVAAPAIVRVASIMPIKVVSEFYVISVDTALGPDTNAITVWHRTLSGGEYILSAEQVMTIGQGDVEQGRVFLDEMIRAQALNWKPRAVMIRPMAPQDLIAERYPTLS